MSNLHPTFEAILKPHLQGQTVVARKRIHPDDAREAFGVLALHFGGATADTSEAVQLYRRLEGAWDRAILALGAAQERRERIEEETNLDARYEYEQLRKAKEQFEAEDAEAEREERRQYREWRNDSGV